MQLSLNLIGCSGHSSAPSNEGKGKSIDDAVVGFGQCLDEECNAADSGDQTASDSKDSDVLREKSAETVASCCDGYGLLPLDRLAPQDRQGFNLGPTPSAGENQLSAETGGLEGFKPDTTSMQPVETRFTPESPQREGLTSSASGTAEIELNRMEVGKPLDPNGASRQPDDDGRLQPNSDANPFLNDKSSQVAELKSAVIAEPHRPQPTAERTVPQTEVLAVQKGMTEGSSELNALGAEVGNGSEYSDAEASGFSFGQDSEQSSSSSPKSNSDAREFALRASGPSDPSSGFDLNAAEFNPLEDRLIAKDLNSPTASGTSSGLGQSIIDQVVEQLPWHDAAAMQSAITDRQLKVQIYPEMLGQLEITVVQSEEGLVAQIEASERVTSELLSREKEQLLEALSEKGLEFPRLDISHRDSQGRARQEESQPETWSPPVQTRSPRAQSSGNRDLRSRSSTLIDVLA